MSVGVGQISIGVGRTLNEFLVRIVYRSGCDKCGSESRWDWSEFVWKRVGLVTSH